MLWCGLSLFKTHSFVLGNECKHPLQLQLIFNLKVGAVRPTACRYPLSKFLASLLILDVGGQGVCTMRQACLTSHAN